MSTAYCERTLYIATADTRRITEAITQLFAREDMVVIQKPKERTRTHYAAMMFGSMQHNTWGVAIIPGKGDWRRNQGGSVGFALGAVARRWPDALCRTKSEIPAVNEGLAVL